MYTPKYMCKHKDASASVYISGKLLVPMLQIIYVFHLRDLPASGKLQECFVSVFI